MATEPGLSMADVLRDALASLSQQPGTAICMKIIGAALILFVVDGLRSWYRLSHVPGPFWAALSKTWMVRQSLKGQQPYAIQKANEKYGERLTMRATQMSKL